MSETPISPLRRRMIEDMTIRNMSPSTRNVYVSAVACLSAQRARARWGAFLIAFGVWDIVYYVALYAMLRWPPSLTTMDVLFLIPPGPWWNQPVWLPVSISCVMIAIGFVWFRDSEPA